MKRICKICLIMSIMILSNKIFALSDNFQYVIETVGIPRYNVYKEEINQIVYETYNVFVYSDPVELLKQYVGQRWSNSKYGLWTKNGSKYVGYGIRGEYELLGRDYFGNVVYNYQFTMDSIPTTSPETWSYVTVKGANNSWQNQSGLLTQSQIDYMKNAKWLFADITKPNEADDPNNQIEYNLTANTVGLEKVRMEIAATWRTRGSVYIEHKKNNKIWYATFAIPPMEAMANIKGHIIVMNENVLETTQKQINIPIEYGCEVYDLTKYASIEDVQKINSIMYINGEKVGEVSGSKTSSMGDIYMLEITRDKFSPNQTHQINIRVDSFIQTKFAMDGLIQNSITKQITIKVLEELIEPIQTTQIMQLTKNDDETVVSPLAQLNTNQYDTVGFTEAGKYLTVKCVMATQLKNITNINDYSIKLDGKKLNNVTYDICQGNVIFKFQIPFEVETTLYGINSLRNSTGSYYMLDSKHVGDRYKAPHELLINFCVFDYECKSMIMIDTIDSYITNINSSIVACKMLYKEKYEQWIKI